MKEKDVIQFLNTLDKKPVQKLVEKFDDNLLDILAFMCYAEQINRDSAVIQEELDNEE